MIKEALENPDQYEVEWGEPWPAIDNHGSSVIANIRSTCSIQDAINMSRRSALHSQAKINKGIDNLTDEDFLDQFIVIYWAIIKKVK